MNVNRYFLLQMIIAPITPGIQASSVRMRTIKIEPQPLSITASGGKIMHRITRQRDILFHINGSLRLLLETNLAVAFH